MKAVTRRWRVLWGVALGLLAWPVGCTRDDGRAADGAKETDDGSTSSGSDPESEGSSGGPISTSGAETGADVGDTEDTPDVAAVDVRLVPQVGHEGMQRINFAVPLERGRLFDADEVTVRHAGAEVAAGKRGLATHPDGSLRSVQVQIELDVQDETTVTVLVGEPSAMPSLQLIAVRETLVVADGTEGPRVWALLPAAWLSASGVAGPLAPAEDFESTPAAAWLSICDYDTHDTAAFLSQSGSAGPWLYDRGTAMARGYAITGDLVPLRSQYRETSLYRSTTTGSGANVQIPVPGATNDVKYHYAQNLAIHYLLTGDERFAELAGDIAARMRQLWSSPSYAGGADFWTERHAGFALLAYVWAAIVAEDDAEGIWAWADETVDAYLDVQSTYPAGYDDPEARCFAHHADAHGEPYGYFGCSPWMSAILADGLEQYALERGGARAQEAWDAVVKLGRILAEKGTDASGKPYYWMGVGTVQNEVDPYDEHWGESAYVIAMAHRRATMPEPSLLDAAEDLIAGLGTHGSVPHVRSFNWQCRSAVATPWYLARP
jgi:hypothetical protein